MSQNPTPPRAPARPSESRSRMRPEERRLQLIDVGLELFAKRTFQELEVAEICRKHGISSAAFYKWRSKYGGMDASMLKRVKELEAENARLKKMYAESQMDQQILKEALAKKW